MKAFLFSSFILSAFWSIAQSGDQNKKAFKVITDSLNLNLSANQSKFTFIIDERDIEKTAFPVTLYGLVNGLRKEIVSDDQGRFSIVVDSGKVNLQIQISHGNFYYQTGILELEILEQHETTGFLRFEKKEPPRVVPCKPVIYFHTASKQEFDLSVKPVGEFTFVYPEMNDSWKGTAYPNGDITIYGNNYPYLFWESSQRYAFHSEGNGFKVEKKDVISFLEKKLTELGLNQKEQTDFITYWGPKLAANENSFVQFSLDEKCDQFATLSCSPQPEAVHRVFIQIAKWDPYFELFLKDVTFSSGVNEKWSLLEWGGFTFSKPEELTQKL